MIVYGSTLSPFVRKVMAFAAEKGLAPDLRPAMGGGAEFAEASPLGKMPALRDPGAEDGHDFCIADSSAIVAYLEAKQPEPALIPAAPIARARTIWFEEFGDTLLAGAGAKIFYNRFVLPRFRGVPGDEAVAATAERDELPPLLDYLERTVPDAGFLVGNAITLADIAVVSPLVNLMHLGIGLDRWPRVRAYAAAILDRPSFAGMVDAERTMIARMA